MKKLLVTVAILVSITVLISYSQYANKKIIQAVLQSQLDINNPPELISAILAYDQTLKEGKSLPKGTKFTGMLSKESNNILIYFDTIEFADGKKSQFYAKSNLNIKDKVQGGVSSKIGKTLNEQTRTNVLGAIFHTSTSRGYLQNSLVLPQGTLLKIEID